MYIRRVARAFVGQFKEDTEAAGASMLHSVWQKYNSRHHLEKEPKDGEAPRTVEWFRQHFSENSGGYIDQLKQLQEQDEADAAFLAAAFMSGRLRV